MRTLIHDEFTRRDLISMYSKKLYSLERYMVDPDNGLRMASISLEPERLVAFKELNDAKKKETPQIIENYKQYLEILRYYD